jgi:dsRNA-specific ribonuclease
MPNSMPGRAKRAHPSSQQSSSSYGNQQQKSDEYEFNTNDGKGLSERYEAAFIHPSALNVQANFKLVSNERLEFLGDGILQAIASAYVYEKYPSVSEGVLTDLRSSIVNKGACAKFTSELGLVKYLVIDERSTHRIREFDNAKGDLFEALGKRKKQIDRSRLIEVDG